MKHVKAITTLLFIVWPLAYASAAIPTIPAYEYQGNGELKFYNTHSGELVEINYKDDNGNYKKNGIDEINHVLRCRLTGKETQMDMKLIALIDHIQDHFRVDEIDIISGYRSPELNADLRAAGRGVASRSYHLVGKAIDIRIPGVDLKKLKDYAASLRAGGVGYYPGPDFVHIDVGPVRYW